MKEAAPITRTRSGRSSDGASVREPEPQACVGQPRARHPGPHQLVPRAQPLLQHRRLQPGGQAGHQRGPARRTAPARPPSSTASRAYLYWLAWVARTRNSLFSTSDAEGPLRRALFMFDCNSIHAIARQTRAARPTRCFGPLSSMLSDAKFCGGASQVMPKQAPSVGRILAMVVFALVVLRDPAVPVDFVRRPGAAQAEGLPIQGRLPRGHHARPAGGRAHRRRERGQGHGDEARQGRRPRRWSRST